MYLNEAAKRDVQWWLKNIDSADNDIYHENPSLSLTTDASKSGWGATLNSLRTGGTLSYEESLEHINVLDLIAVLFGLQSLIKQSKIHVKVLCDNTTAVHTINNMGTSHSLACDKVVKQIWQFAISKSLWISATHLPGRLNKDADEELRKNELRLELKLNETVFREIQHAFGRAPEIDLFASRLNYQIQPFLSYRPDPECFAVNAFLIPWGQFLTSAQRSAEVRALQRTLSFYLSFGVCLQFVVYASLILDGLPFHASKDFNSYQLLQTKRQSRDLSVFMFYSLLIINNTSRSCKALAER